MTASVSTAELALGQTARHLGALIKAQSLFFYRVGCRRRTGDAINADRGVEFYLAGCAATEGSCKPAVRGAHASRNEHLPWPSTMASRLRKVNPSLEEPHEIYRGNADPVRTDCVGFQSPVARHGAVSV